MRFLPFSIALVASLHFAANASAFRTGSSLPKFTGTERVRWTSNEVAFDLVSALPSGINPYDISHEFVRAFRLWSSPECSGFRATFGQLTPDAAKFGDGHNTIQLVSTGWEALGYAANAAGATDIRYEKRADGTWAIAEADIYVNAEAFKWTTDAVAADGYRTIFSVLLHEGGHALGLLHPCEENGEAAAPKCNANGISPSSSVMYPVYDSSQGALTSDDQAGVCFLYQKCESAGCPAGFDCSANGCSMACASDQTTGRCEVEQVCSPTGCVSSAECAATDCLIRNVCASDAECAAGDYCSANGTCETGTMVFGDACTASRQCRNGVCADPGYCVPACSDDSSCGANASCRPLTDGHSDAGAEGRNAPSPGGCIGPRRPMGQVCSESNQCLGGECLSGAHKDPVCTRLCDGGEPACPASWTCGLVEGRKVCVPLVATGGCTLSARSGYQSPAGGGFLCSLGGGFILAFALRLARRRSQARAV